MKPHVIMISMLAGFAFIGMVASARVSMSTNPVPPWFNAAAVDLPPLPTTFENGIALLGDDGHWYRAEVDDGELLPIQISNSPLDPATAAVMREAAKQARRAARQEWRTVTLGIKTGVVQVIRETRVLLQAGTGLLDRVQFAQVSTNASTGQVRSGYRELNQVVVQFVRDKRDLERSVRDLSIQVRELTDTVRQQSLKVDTKAEPTE